MEVILKFIGIILLVGNPAVNPTTYDVYIPDGRISKPICNEMVPEHLPAIRVKGSVDPKKWPWIRCHDGIDCRLFLLEHDAIVIEGISNGAGVTTKPKHLMKIPHFQDDMHVNKLINTTAREDQSAGWLTLAAGTLTDGTGANGMNYAVLDVTVPGDLVIRSGDKSIRIPAQSNGVIVDFINVPQEQATEVLDAAHGTDYRHFLLHYVYADAGNKTCEYPTQHSKIAEDHGHPSPADTRYANADCSATTWP